MKKSLLTIISITWLGIVVAQTPVYQTFKDRWVINTPSVETLPKRKLDFRVAHRFGDIAGKSGGWTTFYGFENAADVSFAFEYGLNNRLTIGFGRSKGAGQLGQLLTGSLKYSILQQQTEGTPLSLAVVGFETISASKKSSDPSSLNYFEKFSHRVVYHAALLAAKKFGNHLSVQLSGGYTHRNVVPAGEANGIVHAGLATRIQVTKALGIIGDFTLPLNGHQSPFESGGNRSYYPPLGIGFEFETGGHVFQVNFTNSKGIMPTDYIPYTVSNWLDGQYRFGFTISRIFNL